MKRIHRGIGEHSWRLSALAAGVLLAVLALALWQLFRDNTQRVTESDATVIWYAARELSPSRLHQPNFYGQSYFTVFEALPAKLLSTLGVPLQIAAPAATTALMFGVWPLLALGAWLGAKRIAACAALAVPLVMCDEYLVAVSQPGGRAAGTFIAGVGLAVLMARPRSLLAVAIAVACGGIGTAFDPGAALFTLPALVYALAVNRRRWLLLPVVAAALVPTALWLAFSAAFYAAHPADNFFPHASTPSLSTLGANLVDVGRFFSYLSPELLRVAAVPLVVAGLLVLRLLWLHSAVTVLTALAAVAVVLVALATAQNGGTASPYFSYSRYLFDFPLLVWLLIAAGEDMPKVARQGRFGRYAVAGIAVLALVSAGYRETTLHTRLASLNKLSTPTTPDALVDVRALLNDCHALDRAVTQTGVRVVVFRGLEATLPYGCGAVDYGRYETLLPAFDRRTWLMQQEATLQRTVFLVSGGVSSAWCAEAVTAGAQTCTLDPSDSRVAVVRTPPVTILAFWNRIGELVRCPYAPASRCLP